MSAKEGGWFWTQKTVISRPYCNNFFFLRSHFQLKLSLNKLSMILDLLISLPLVLKNISNWHQLKKSIKFGNLILLSEMNEKSIFMKLYDVLQIFVICLLWYYFVKFDLGGVKRKLLFFLILMITLVSSLKYLLPTNLYTIVFCKIWSWWC